MFKGYLVSEQLWRWDDSWTNGKSSEDSGAQLSPLIWRGFEIAAGAKIDWQTKREIAHLCDFTLGLPINKFIQGFTAGCIENWRECIAKVFPTTNAQSPFEIWPKIASSSSQRMETHMVRDRLAPTPGGVLSIQQWRLPPQLRLQGSSDGAAAPAWEVAGSTTPWVLKRKIWVSTWTSAPVGSIVCRNLVVGARATSSAWSCSKKRLSLAFPVQLCSDAFPAPGSSGSTGMASEAGASEACRTMESWAHPAKHLVVWRGGRQTPWALYCAPFACCAKSSNYSPWRPVTHDAAMQTNPNNICSL